MLPSHAVELPAAPLDPNVADTIARLRVAAATLSRKQDLATIIHLCGAGAGDAYAPDSEVNPRHRRRAR